MVYIEIILFISVLIHILFIKNTCLLLGKKINKKLLVLSSVLTCIYTLLYLLRPSLIKDYKFIIILFIGILNFITSKKQLFLGGVLYISQNFMLGGISGILVNIIEFNIIFLLLITISFVIISYFYKEYSRYDVNIKSLYYTVKIVYNNKIYILKAYCDTGNFLTDESFVPVVFLNKKFKIGKKKKSVSCSSIATTRKISLYEVDSFYILINDEYIKKDVYLAYSNISFDLIIGLSLLGG